MDTYGVYRDDLNNTWSTTTSNDETSQEEGNSTPCCVLEVHLAESFDFSPVCKEATHMIDHPGQAGDTPQVRCQVLFEMFLLAFGKSENPPKYPIAIYLGIVLNHSCHPWCLPILIEICWPPSLNAPGF